MLRRWTGSRAPLLILHISILQRLGEDGRGVPFLILAKAPFTSALDVAFPCGPSRNQVRTGLPLLLFLREGGSRKRVPSPELQRKVLRVPSFPLNRATVSFLDKKAATEPGNFSNNVLICMIRAMAA